MLFSTQTSNQDARADNGRRGSRDAETPGVSCRHPCSAALNFQRHGFETFSHPQNRRHKLQEQFFRSQLSLQAFYWGPMESSHPSSHIHLLPTSKPQTVILLSTKTCTPLVFHLFPSQFLTPIGLPNAPYLRHHRPELSFLHDPLPLLPLILLPSLLLLSKAQHHILQQERTTPNCPECCSRPLTTLPACAPTSSSTRQRLWATSLAYTGFSLNAHLWKAVKSPSPLH